jgi:hypothetical protein
VETDLPQLPIQLPGKKVTVDECRSKVASSYKHQHALYESLDMRHQGVKSHKRRNQIRHREDKNSAWFQYSMQFFQYRLIDAQVLYQPDSDDSIKVIIWKIQVCDVALEQMKPLCTVQGAKPCSGLANHLSRKINGKNLSSSLQKSRDKIPGAATGIKIPTLLFVKELKDMFASNDEIIALKARIVRIPGSPRVGHFAEVIFNQLFLLRSVHPLSGSPLMTN